MASDDLQVQALSDALNGLSLDLIVSGSIGAVESVRLIRALRRLGANIHPWLTQGGALFTSPTALSWAAAGAVKTQFEGTASHLATHDACIVAPASASLIGKVAHGMTDSPATALIASYLGQGKKVLLVANMHDSLMQSPFVAANLEKLRGVCTVLESRQEEGKHKFPEPAQLADDIAHHLRAHPAMAPVLLTMGTTRGYIDSVRYISNYSSGALGTEICHEFYRQGYPVHVVAGPCPHQPRSYAQLISIETNEDMSAGVQKVQKLGIKGAIFAASVLDFVPAQRIVGKIRSSEDLQVSFVKTPKIIAQVTEPLDFKIGFKLETELTAESPALATAYLQRYQLSHLLMNLKSEVDARQHRAVVYTRDRRDPMELTSKAAIAHFLVKTAQSSASPGCPTSTP